MPLGSRGPSPMRPPPFNAAVSYKVQDAISPMDDRVHPVLHEGRVAVITGAGSGIGRAAAIELARLGLKIAIVDVDEVGLKNTAEIVIKLFPDINVLYLPTDVDEEGLKNASELAGDANVLYLPTDVSKLDEVVRLKDKVYDAWGEVAVLVNNACVGHIDGEKGNSWTGRDIWTRVFDINIVGVLNVQHTFVPLMLHQENPSVVINTGSKQGITNPPGNAAYNASKAAIKSLTESLAYELRTQSDPHVTAHLFIPGWAYTSLTAGLPVASVGDKPDGAWSAEETVVFMLDRVRVGDFYILVPDNETRREVDELRMMWGAADITEGRPALSRWHPNYMAAFDEYMKDGLAQLN